MSRIATVGRRWTLAVSLVSGALLLAGGLGLAAAADAGFDGDSAAASVAADDEKKKRKAEKKAAAKAAKEEKRLQKQRRQRGKTVRAVVVPTEPASAPASEPAAGAAPAGGARGGGRAGDRSQSVPRREQLRPSRQPDPRLSPCGPPRLHGASSRRLPSGLRSQFEHRLLPRLAETSN